MPCPQLLFGGASLGRGAFATLEQVNSLLTILRQHNIHRIDTAALYPSANPGGSEGILGDARAVGLLDDFTVDTKILTTSADGTGTLTKSAIYDSVTKSKQRLVGSRPDEGKAPISTLYCHVFDSATPLQETTSTLAELHKGGHAFKTLGVSNFAAGQVESFISSCEATGCPHPILFQGLYNALSRNAERSLPRAPDSPSLFSTLRKHGLRYIAWSPLAGGFLTGKFTRGEKGTRFDTDNGRFHKFMYDKPSMHGAVKMLEEACANAQGTVGGVGKGESTITPLGEASLRWLYYHSALDEQDGMIMGAHTAGMIEVNCLAINRGPLPDVLVEAFEKAWEMVQKDAPMF